MIKTTYIFIAFLLLGFCAQAMNDDDLESDGGSDLEMQAIEITTITPEQEKLLDKIAASLKDGNNESLVQHLRKISKDLLNDHDYLDLPLVPLAVKSNNVFGLAALIGANADVDVAAKKTGFTGLHILADNKVDFTEQLAQQLFGAGAKLDLQDASNRTPTQRCTLTSNVKLAKLIRQERERRLAGDQDVDNVSHGKFPQGDSILLEEEEILPSGIIEYKSCPTLVYLPRLSCKSVAIITISGVVIVAAAVLIPVYLCALEIICSGSDSGSGTGAPSNSTLSHISSNFTK